MEIGMGKDLLKLLYLHSPAILRKFNVLRRDGVIGLRLSALAPGERGPKGAIKAEIAELSMWVILGLRLMALFWVIMEGVVSVREIENMHQLISMTLENQDNIRV